MEQIPRGSEVARLRQQIADEYDAIKQALEGPAVVGRHDIISHRHGNLDEHYAKLCQYMSEEQAATTVWDIRAYVLHSGAQPTGERQE